MPDEISLKEYLERRIATIEDQVNRIGHGVRESVKKHDIVDKGEVMKTIGKADRVASELYALQKKVDVMENDLVLATAKISTHRRYFGYIVGVLVVAIGEMVAVLVN